MKTHTSEEILKKVLEIWSNSSASDLEAKVQQNAEEIVQIEMTAMYSPPGLTLSQLVLLSEFFGTDNITEAGGFSYGGCETCDYGSAYGFTLTIEEKHEKE